MDEIWDIVQVSKITEYCQVHSSSFQNICFGKIVEFLPDSIYKNKYDISDKKRLPEWLVQQFFNISTA